VEQLEEVGLAGVEHTVEWPARLIKFRCLTGGKDNLGRLHGGAGLLVVQAGREKIGYRLLQLGREVGFKWFSYSHDQVTHVYIFLGKGLRIGAHHVGQVPLADLELQVLGLHELVVLVGSLQVRPHGLADLLLLDSRGSSLDGHLCGKRSRRLKGYANDWSRFQKQ